MLIVQYEAHWLLFTDQPLQPSDTISTPIRAPQVCESFYEAPEAVLGAYLTDPHGTADSQVGIIRGRGALWVDVLIERLYRQLTHAAKLQTGYTS